MAVAFDAVGPSGGGGTQGTGSPLTWTHICGSSATAIVIALDNGSNTTVGVSAVTYGGVACTALGHEVNTGGSVIFLYGLINPPTGSNTVSVTFSIGGGEMLGGSVSFTGAGSFGSFFGSQTGGAAASNETVAVTNTTTGGMILTSGAFGGNGFSTFSTTGSGGTIQVSNPFSSAGPGEMQAVGTYPSTGGGASQTVGISAGAGGADEWALGAVEVLPPWSFVNSGSDQAAGGTALNNSASPVCTVPSGLAAGDVLILDVMFYAGSSQTITSYPSGFTQVLAATSAGGLAMSRNVAVKIATGSESTLPVSLSGASWGTLISYALRSTSGGTPSVFNHGSINSASSSTALADASLTIYNSADATVYGYAGTNSAGSGAETITASPASLSNFTSESQSAAGNVAGIGWGVDVSSPGGATASSAIFEIDWALDISLGAPPEVLPGNPLQSAVPGIPEPWGFVPGLLLPDPRITMSVTGTVLTNVGPGGVLLRVWVITGASSSPVGTNKGSNSWHGTTTAAETSITTTTTNSRVYGCLEENNTNTTLTAAANTTLVDNQADASNSACYASAKATSLTGSPGATTIGSTSSFTSGSIGLVEILPGSGLAEDSSQPASVHSFTAVTVSTATFAPPPGSLLVAAFTGEGDGSNVQTAAVTDSFGLTWTQQVFACIAGSGFSGVWTAKAPGSSGGTVHNLSILGLVELKPVLIRSAGRTIQGKVELKPSVKRSLGKIITALLVITATVKRNIARTILGLVELEPTIIASRLKNLTLTATVELKAVLTRSTGRNLTAKTELIPGTQRSIGRSLSGKVELVPSVRRSLGKIITALTELIPSVKRSIARTITSLVGLIPSLSQVRVHLIALLASIELKPAVTRQVSRTLTALTELKPAVSRQVEKILTSLVELKPALTTVKVKLVTLIAQIEVKAGLANRIGRNLQAQVELQPSVVRSIGKIIIAKAELIPSLVRSIAKGITGLIELKPVLTTIKVKLVSLVTQIELKPAVARQIGFHLTTQLELIPSTIRKCGKIISSKAEISAGLIRSIGRILTSKAELKAAFTGIKVTLLTLIAQVELKPSVRRVIARPITGTVELVPQVTRALSRTIQGTIVLAGQTARQISRVISSKVELPASVTALRVRIIALSTTMAISVGSLKRGLGKYVIGTLELIPSLTRGISRKIITQAELTPVLVHGRAFLVSLVTQLEMAPSVVAQAIRLSFLTIFKAGNATVNWITGSIKKNWRVP